MATFVSPDPSVHREQPIKVGGCHPIVPTNFIKIVNQQCFFTLRCSIFVLFAGKIANSFSGAEISKGPLYKYTQIPRNVFGLNSNIKTLKRMHCNGKFQKECSIFFARLTIMRCLKSFRVSSIG